MMIFSERPTSIIAFLKVLSRMNRSWMLSYFFFAAFPCKLIRRMVLYASRCVSIPVTVWPALPDVEVRDGNKSSTAEMYFLFSAESSVIRCPHVQYTIPVLQRLRHALHCNFGSTLIISHSLVFPAARIASFDFSLKGLNGRCC